ncbi:MAG: 4-(cytidine 5'-diphospho)-2-C-methyl-D-erythritol kinase [Eubacteriales bacterium]|nr:4-(cytidine 5'-diphospho)-2-C-methyl-D-erythritol kinase [Eubacteriales bacterium]
MNMKLEAHAKINIALDVTGILPNGYHKVKMIMQEIGLHDDVYVDLVLKGENLEADCGKTCEGKDVHACDADNKTAIETEDTAIKITCTVMDEDGNDIPGVPTDEKNIAVKAARLMLDEAAARKASGLSCGHEAGVDCTDIRNIEEVRIKLVKRIPAAAGMAGGSTDAAAVLKALNEMLSLNLSQVELMVIGLKIGADVPYCIIGGTALAEGIGEMLTPLKKMPHMPLLLIKPAEGVSTKEIYTALDEILAKDKPWLHPDVDTCAELLPLIETPGVVLELSMFIGNILELVTAERLPVIHNIKSRMMDEGAIVSMMSGSGPTVFGLFYDEETRDKAYDKLAAEFSGMSVIKTST